MFAKPVELGSHMIAREKGHTRTLPPLEFCMYCLRPAKDVGRLTNEHVVPKGIHGDVLLQRSTCDDCTKEINVWERRVQEGHLGFGRDVLNISSGRKRKDKRGPAYSLVSGRHESDANFDEMPKIPISEDMPAVIFTEMLAEHPNVIKYSPFQALIQDHAVVERDADLPVTLHFEAGEGDYLRLIAKAAHGMAFCILGENLKSRYNLTLPGLILGGDIGQAQRYIGSKNMGKFEAMHRISVRREYHYLSIIENDPGVILIGEAIVVYVQLFAWLGAPTYQVLVGYRPT